MSYFETRKIFAYLTHISGLILYISPTITLTPLKYTGIIEVMRKKCIKCKNGLSRSNIDICLGCWCMYDAPARSILHFLILEKYFNIIDYMILNDTLGTIDA